MAEEVDALLKEIRKKNTAKRRALLLQGTSGASPAVLRVNGRAKEENISEANKGLLKKLDRVLSTKTKTNKREYDEIASRINVKK
jgi:hypothetical protein